VTCELHALVDGAHGTAAFGDVAGLAEKQCHYFAQDSGALGSLRGAQTSDSDFDIRIFKQPHKSLAAEPGLKSRTSKKY
jgi:predicted nucleotidyltransferase